MYYLYFISVHVYGDVKSFITRDNEKKECIEETEEAAEEVIIYKKNSRNSFRKIFFRK